MIFSFSVFSILFTLMFVLILGIFLFVIIRGFRQWNKNNRSPVLTVQADIVSKRSQVTGTPDAGTFSSYFVTFQVESGGRIEFSVPAREYGMLAEGDHGKLTFQGTRYLRFDRE